MSMLRKHSDTPSFTRIVKEKGFPTIGFKNTRRQRIVIHGMMDWSLIFLGLHLFDLQGVRRTAVDVLEGPASPRFIEFLSVINKSLVALEPDLEAWYKNIITKEEELKAAKVSEPPGLNTKAWRRLRPYQRQAVSFLVTAERTILGDEPGLGKTATALVATQVASKPKARNLIVCPASLKEWWAEEAQEWLDSPSIVIAEAGKYDRQLLQFLGNHGGFFIVNYELLLRMPQLSRVAWDWLIADEAHRIKNNQAKTTKAFHKLRAEYATLLTATPLSNRPSELWSLLHYLRPVETPPFGFFRTFYQEEYITPSGWSKPAGPKKSTLRLLKREHEPVMIRRLKGDVESQLPPKRYQRIPLWMTPQQVKAYRQMVHDSLVELENDILIAIDPAVIMLRLRQITSSLATIGGGDISAKVDACVELLKDRDPEPMVFFTVFRETAKTLVARLRKLGISAELFIGDMKPKDEQKAISNFRSGKARAFVATVQKGGVGLNLQRASTLVFIDKHWSPALQDQAEDRIHRIGQEKPCLIISLHHRHTIDDYVENLLRRKQRWNAQVIRQELKEHLEDSLLFL